MAQANPENRRRGGKVLEVAVMLIGIATAGCEYKDPFAAEWTTKLAPVSTRTSVVFADETNARALVYVPGKEGDALRSVPLGGGALEPLWMVAAPGGDEVFALEYAPDPRNESSRPTLVRFAADGLGEATRIELKAAFPSIRFTPDGEHAVLYFGNEGTGEVIENENQVAILALASNDVRDLTLDGFGSAVNSVVFPGQGGVGNEMPVVVDGVERRLAVFLMANECVILDLANPEANQLAVKFDATLPLTPEQVLVRPGDSAIPEPTLLLVDAAGYSLDLVALRLLPKADLNAGPLDLTVQVGLLPLKSPAGELALLTQGGVPWVIATQPYHNEIEFVDLRTAASIYVAVPNSPSRIFLREAVNSQQQTVTQLVAWDDGGYSISTLELDKLGESIGQKPVELAIAGQIESVRRVDAANLLVGAFSGQIYAVNLDTKSIAPLSTEAEFDVEGAYELGSQLLLAAPNDLWIGVIELPNLDPRGVLLDQPISSMHVLEDSDLIVTVHADATGGVTVLDANDPSRATARSRWGLLLEGALD